jgi:glycosyltransferase involved in cell wall biosynthesis
VALFGAALLAGAAVKVLLYTDLTIRRDQLFWHRDLGLLTKAYRTLGHDAWLVVHPAKLRPPESKVRSKAGPSPATRDDPVIWAAPCDVLHPGWWQSHKPDLVILGLWTRPQYDSIRRAALSATPRVIERADSDGMRTASCGLLTYVKRRFDYFRDRTCRWPAFLSIPVSALYSFASILATPWMEARLARTLKLIPALAVETPAATQLWRELAAKLGADPKRIHCVPHPIQTDIFRLDPKLPKKKQVISVGRWESYQKNLPLLLKTLIPFLHQKTDWSALVVGSGLPASPPHPRITFSPPLPAPRLSRRMQESRIFLSSSRYESFGLAAAEAALSGCRVVALGDCLPGWPRAPSMGSHDGPMSNLMAAAENGPRPRSPAGKLSLAPNRVAALFLRIAGTLKKRPPRLT